jgi:putative MATE family efflux protein
VAAASYWFTAVSFAYSNVLRSILNVRMPLIVAATALSVNTVLNWILIFGLFGFPALGVRGSAIATVIARVLELGLLLGGVYAACSPLAASGRELFSFDAAYVRKFFVVSVPVILNEFTWSLGITVYGVVFARIGTDAFAAFSITDTISRLAVVLFFGTSNACSVMVGNAIGARDYRRARYCAASFSILGPILGLAVGILTAGVSWLIPLAFQVSSHVRGWVSVLLVIFSIFLPIKVFNWHLVVGILRSGGDTRFSLIMEAGTIWLLGVPLVAFTGLILHLPVYLVFLALNSEEAVKSVIGILRLRSGRWLNDLTKE